MIDLGLLELSRDEGSMFKGTEMVIYLLDVAYPFAHCTRSVRSCLPAGARLRVKRGCNVYQLFIGNERESC